MHKRSFHHIVLKSMDIAFLNKLRLLGIIEGISTLVLFGIAMPLKYMADIPEAVSIVGMAHGLLFILLVIMFFIAIERVPIGARLGIIGILAAIIPLGPFVVDIWLKRLADRENADGESLEKKT